MARIPEQEITHLKQTTDLVAVIKGQGVKLRKTGNLYKGRCPFHEEKTPSFTVTPAENLWHCFGCDMGGDVIRFVELMDKVSFPEAFKRLSGDQISSPVAETNKPTASKKTPSKKFSSLTAAPDPSVVNPAQRTKLLTRVMLFYAKCFANRPEGMKYLIKQRGIQGVTHFKNYQLGYADGSLLEALPQDKESLDRFKSLGILTNKGRELLHDCIVFPLFDNQGNMVNLYGRRLVDGKVNHRKLIRCRI